MRDQEAASRDLQAIANALAHDWKGPLNTVSLYAGVLEMKHPEDEEIQTIVRAAGQVLTRFKALSLYLRTHDVGEGPACLQDLRPEDRERLQAHDVSGWDTELSIDSTSLGRLVMALVDNAEQHGQGPVRVVAERAGDADVLRVTDSGPGLPDSMVGRATTLLVSSSPTTHAGVGLALAERVATECGGSLQLTKADGSFTVEARWPRRI